ncbi:uncharacterized protein LOC123527126 isoform X2 [Mercenaria mercenaria]|nr:uncharacterized protein LOC123527126 isoform X2 [Mercenaria mercenaria]
MSVAGMDQWCLSNCKEGNDPDTCPESYCTCPEILETTSVTTVSANNLESSCIKWEATVAWSAVRGMNSWCQSSCSLGGMCPESYCLCIESLPTTTTVSSTSSTPTASSTTSTSATSTAPTTTNTPTTSTTSTSTPSTSSTTTTTTSTTSTLSTAPTTTSTPTTSTTSSTSTSSATTTTSTPSTLTPSTTATTPTSTPSSSTTNTPTISSTTASTSASSTSSTSVTTLAVQVVNITDSQAVVSQVVCDHADSLNQNLLTDRYCSQQAATVITGYNSGILDQVLKFAPKILCSLTNSAGRSDTCPNMFCGESPLSQQLIRSSLCSVCQQFSDTLAPSCATAYCS